MDWEKKGKAKGGVPHDMMLVWGHLLYKVARFLYNLVLSNSKSFYSPSHICFALLISIESGGTSDDQKTLTGEGLEVGQGCVCLISETHLPLQSVGPNWRATLLPLPFSFLYFFLTFPPPKGRGYFCSWL